MSKEKLIAFIVEGESREPQFIDNMKKVFFGKGNFMTITLPVGENIYMLWQTLKNDDFEIDIIDIVREKSAISATQLDGHTREDFAEIYLFFDYDAHHIRSQDLVESDVLEEMLKTFYNETENGKLYISYPMCESLRDYVRDQCTPATTCLWEIARFADYKEESGNHSPNPNVKGYICPEWADILSVFAMRISCLFGHDKVLSYEEYKTQVTPFAVYMRQRPYVDAEKTFILSAFPEFILDYFKEPFWRSQISFSKLIPDQKRCPQKNSRIKKRYQTLNQAKIME